MNAGSKLHFFLDGKRVKTRLKSSARRPEPRPAPLPCAAVHLLQRLERACFVRGARRQAWGADRRRRGQLNGDDQFSFQNAKSEIPVAIRTELLGRRLHISVWNSGGGCMPETELGPWRHTIQCCRREAGRDDTSPPRPRDPRGPPWASGPDITRELRRNAEPQVRTYFNQI